MVQLAPVSMRRRRKNRLWTWPHVLPAFAAFLWMLAAAEGGALDKPGSSESAESAWHATFAQRLVAAWEQGKPMPQLTANYPDATLDDGFAIQRLFVKRSLADVGIGGFKAAGVSQAARDRNGREAPMTGIIPADGVYSFEDGVVVDLAKDPNRHVETEVGYIFATPVTNPLPDVRALRQHVEYIAAIIELPGNPIERTKPGSTADMVAWNINAKALIVGPRHNPEEIDADAVEISLTRDGTVINTAKGSEAAGGQWDTLLKTVNEVVGRGYTVEAGHVITNGALGTIREAEPGHYRADYGSLGVIEFDVK